MLINSANLDALRAGFNAAYMEGLSQAPSYFDKIATTVNSTQLEQKYGWLGKIPRVREWVGPRAIQNLSQSDYTIKEKAWELTISVDKDNIETDNLGIYGPMFREMGASTKALPDQLIFSLLTAGFSTNCYDGQFFFDTDHPVLDVNGNVTNGVNTDGGAGTPWFLLCTNMPLKPLIYQRRKDFEFVAKDKVTDDNVFDNKEFVYGADARANVGYGFWQQAWGSKQTLNAANYEIARAGLVGMKGDFGNPLGLMPNLLVVPANLEGAARRILKTQQGSAGATNEWEGSAELLVVPWL
jgi:phage major head subunit gpT-like protein